MITFAPDFLQGQRAVVVGGTSGIDQSLCTSRITALTFWRWALTPVANMHRFMSSSTAQAPAVTGMSIQHFRQCRPAGARPRFLKTSGVRRLQVKRFLTGYHWAIGGCQRTSQMPSFSLLHLRRDTSLESPFP